MKWLDVLLRRKPVEREEKAERVEYMAAKSDDILDHAERVLANRGRLVSYDRVRLRR